jgi:hypothetical protein
MLADCDFPFLRSHRTHRKIITLVTCNITCFEAFLIINKTSWRVSLSLYWKFWVLAARRYVSTYTFYLLKHAKIHSSLFFWLDCRKSKFMGCCQSVASTDCWWTRKPRGTSVANSLVQWTWCSRNTYSVDRNKSSWSTLGIHSRWPSSQSRKRLALFYSHSREYEWTLPESISQ